MVRQMQILRAEGVGAVIHNGSQVRTRHDPMKKGGGVAANKSKKMTRPYTVSQMSASLEDLSLGNKLPLRQQKDKPMLKTYSSSAPGPTSADMMKQAETAGGYSENGAGDGHTLTGSAPTSPTKAYSHFSRLSPNNSSTSDNSGSPTSNKVGPGLTNPYARPLSAKEIQPSPPPSPLANSPKKKQLEGTYSNGYPSHGNTFLRPQSGVRVRRDSGGSPASTRPGSGRKVASSVTPTGGLVRNEPHLGKSVLQNKPPISKSLRPKSLGFEEKSLSKNTADKSSVSNNLGSDAKSKFMSKVDSMNNDNVQDINHSPNGVSMLIRERPISARKVNGTLTKDSPISYPISKLNDTNNDLMEKIQANKNPDKKRHPRPPSWHKDNFVVGEKNRSPLNSDGESKKDTIHKTGRHVPRPPPGTKVTSVASRPPSANSRPISALSRPGSAKEIAAKVRNKNYTPSKPYSEISDSSSTSTPSKSTPELDNQIESTAVTRTNSEQSSRSPSPSKTLFYHKESKAAEQRPEHRPRADGAPSLTGKREGLSATTLDESDGEEWEDEGEESEFGGAPSVSERQPGDGEAYYDDMDDDDEAIDNLDDDDNDLVSSDDDSIPDDMSMTSGSTRRSAFNRLKSAAAKKRPAPPSSSSAKLRPRSAVTTATMSTPRQPRTEPQSPLTASLFSNVPPTITFVADGETVEQLPWEIRKFFKWRMCSITPNVVKNCISRSGFRPTKKSHDWLGCWGKHMKATGFKGIRDYQKLNHFPGSFQIGRKDRLWRNLSKMQVHFGKKEFSFFPQTYVLPFDMKQLKRAWEDSGSKQKWIIKPPASARGIGIKVIHKWNQIPKKRPVIVQKYLAKPLLINDSKFDMRIYVYVSCYDPLRVYVFEDGLARFASMKYSSSMKSLNNKYMHLTNYSINKKNSGYQANSDDGVCQGHKWSLKALWGYLKKKGVDTKAIWESIKDLIVKTIISSESAVNSMVKSNVKSHYSVHELFGFDVMLDESLKPWVLEVNISPSLHSNSQLDINVKGQMIKDLHNLAGFQIPNKSDITETPCKSVIPKELIQDKRLFSTQLSPDERGKHAYYCQKWHDEDILQTILDTYTPNDLRVLIESIDEDSRKGNFQRIFPTHTTHKYMKYFEVVRYQNLLLDQYLQIYYRQDARGVALIDSFCQKNIHLENPTVDPYHQWCPPSARGDMRTTSAPISKLKGDKSGSLLSLNSQQLPRIKKKLKGTKKMGLHHASSVGSIGSASTYRQQEVAS